MSNTRYASVDAPLAQERYMSSPEYAELRGLSGSAVAAKTALINEPRYRHLLFFLEGRSHAAGGLQKVVNDLLNLFPINLGTGTMHSEGVRPGKKYDIEVAKKIWCELWPEEAKWEHETERFARMAERARKRKQAEYISALPMGEVFICAVENEPSKPQRVYEQSCDALLKTCRALAVERLSQFLTELCINPKIELENASVPYFKEIVPALLEYEERFAKSVDADFVHTKVADLVFETLDLCLQSRKLVVVEGREGIGKSKSAEVWCEMHLGQARFIRLEGVTNKTLLFRAISKALGLPSTFALTATDMQARLRDHLERSGIMLVIDEAHRLFPQTSRISTHPELMNWIYTLWDIHVPVALVVTPQFRTRLSEVERQTDWRSGQLMRRLRRYQQLPEKLQDREILAIAEKLLPNADRAAIADIADTAAGTKFQLDSLANLIDDVRMIAERDGRRKITMGDLDKAKEECWNNSTAAIAAEGAPARKGSKGKKQSPDATQLQPPCSVQPMGLSGHPRTPNKEALQDTESEDNSEPFRSRAGGLREEVLKT